MTTQRMQLAGAERARYFVPTAVCVYLALLCLVLIGVSFFLTALEGALAVTASGLFGLALTGGLGLAFWRAQRRDLVYRRVSTQADAAANFQAVLAAARRAGWRITRQEAPRCLEALASGTLLDAGERVSVRFDGGDVLVASICDPEVGYSLVGRRHCDAHRDLVFAAVTSGTGP